MTYRTDRAFAALPGYTSRHTIGQRITSAIVYTLLAGLSIWAAVAIAVGIIRTISGA